MRFIVQRKVPLSFADPRFLVVFEDFTFAYADEVPDDLWDAVDGGSVVVVDLVEKRFWYPDGAGDDVPALDDVDVEFED